MKPDKNTLPPRGCAPLLVVWALGIGGLAFLAMGIWALIPALQSTSWPTVQGVITGPRIVSSRYQKKMNYDYEVGVNYVYEVERTRHTGHNFTHSTDTLPLPSYDSREVAEAAYASDPSFRNWQAGQLVTVSYDPLHPAESVLQKGADRLALAICLLGAGLLGIAAWEGWKLRRRAAIS